MMRAIPTAACLSLLLLLQHPAAAAEDDEREDYYYPPVSSEEVFERVLGETPPASRTTRVTFVNEVTRAQFEQATHPRVAIFAKGAEAEHMIITALDDEIFRTLHRARAVLAQMTASARRTDFFVKAGLNVHATWLDLAKMLGFQDIVLTDGETWAHRIVLQQ